MNSQNNGNQETHENQIHQNHEENKDGETDMKLKDHQEQIQYWVEIETRDLFDRAIEDGENDCSFCSEDGYPLEFLFTFTNKLADKNMTVITSLSLYDFKFTDEMVSVICRLHWLKSLYIFCNNITNISIKKISEELKELEDLNISYNEEVSDISPLKDLKHLKHLRAVGNKIKFICEDIDYWLQLDYAALHDHPFYDFQLRQLYWLEMKNNNLGHSKICSKLVEMLHPIQ